MAKVIKLKNNNFLYGTIIEEGSKELALLSYSLDYEKALLNAVKINFPKQRAVGCFYLYYKNLYLKVNKPSLLNESYTKSTLTLLNDL